MKDTRTTRWLACLALAAGLAGILPQQAIADPAAECRDEAETYAVPPEQLNDYVQGCIASRGGNYPDAVSQDDVAPADVAPAMEAEPASGGAEDATIPDNSGVEGNSNGAQ
jgi:hypothetical protein